MKIGDKVRLKGTSYLSSFVEIGRVFIVDCIGGKDVTYRSIEGDLQYGFTEDSNLYYDGYEVELLEDESILEEKPATYQELADHVAEVETGAFKAGDLVIALQTISGNEIVKDVLYEVKAVDSYGYLCINLAQLDAMVGVPPEYFESYSEAAEAIEDEPEFQGLMEIVSKSVEKATAGVVAKAASERQTGGNHYKDLKIEPIEYALANKLDFAQGSIIKYVTRFRAKNGIEDLRKAIHCIELLIEFEEKK